MRDFLLFSLSDNIVRSMEDSKLYAVMITRDFLLNYMVCTMHFSYVWKEIVTSHLKLKPEGLQRLLTILTFV